VGLKEGSLVEDAELPGSDEGKWCTTYISVPEAMPEIFWLKMLNYQEAMKARRSIRLDLRDCDI
jgi:hypothetical protein